MPNAVIEKLDVMNDKLDELLKDTNGTQTEKALAEKQRKTPETGAGRKSQASS